MLTLEVLIEQSRSVWESWNDLGVTARATILENWAVYLDQHRARYADAASMVRFQCRQARHLLAQTLWMPGPTGESNTLYFSGRGTFLLLIEANTPSLAIAGGLTAALVAGNTVIPCFEDEQAVDLLDDLVRAGLPGKVLQRWNGLGGALSGDWLRKIGEIEGVLFCGAAEKARRIEATLAARSGAVLQLIAETDMKTYNLMGSPLYLLRFITERTCTINTTSIGGNASLLELK